MREIKADRIISEWRIKMKETETRLVSECGGDILSDGGFYYSTDEEDGFLERVAWGSGKYSDFKTSDEPLLRLLQFWSNDRECWPTEFVREMLKEALKR